jgi:hypothetical protein
MKLPPLLTFNYGRDTLAFSALQPVIDKLHREAGCQCIMIEHLYGVQ